MVFDSLVERIFASSPAVRYVALYRANALSMWERPGVIGASSNETDRYEELFRAYRIANALWALRWYALTGYAAGVERAKTRLEGYLAERGT